LKQFAVLSAGTSAFIFTGCDIIIPEERSLYGPPPIETDPPDKIGNLYIQTLNLPELVLCDRYRRLRIIPGGETRYKVHVVRSIQAESELEIFMYWEIGKVDTPPTSSIFKKWLVNLPVEAIDDPNYIWIIDISTVKECGELIFSYFPHTERELPEIKVDVRLINLETEHIESVDGGRPKHLGLVFGEYTLEYTYWHEDLVNTGQRIVLGRITTEVVNDEEVPIWVVLDAENLKIERTLPNWES